MSYSQQELQDIAAKEEKSLSSEQKKILEKTLNRFLQYRVVDFDYLTGCEYH